MSQTCMIVVNITGIIYNIVPAETVDKNEEKKSLTKSYFAKQN